jgi:hypothetical protein
MFLKRIFMPGKDRFRCAMASMGGVGSTALARHIGSISDKTDREHAYSPAVYDGYSGLRLGYMFGNPYNSVLSIFRRRYQQMHVVAMHAHSRTSPVSLRNMSLEEYLEREVDEFFIERQLDNWMGNVNPRHPTILIRYELLGDHIDTVLDFFACRKAFVVTPRSSSWIEQPEHIRKGLEKIYGRVNEKIEASPAVRIMMPRAGG